MGKLVNRNVPVAGENIEPDGHPAEEMFEDWTEEIDERADNVWHKGNSSDKEKSKVRNERLKEMDKVVKDDLEDEGKDTN